MIYCLEKIMFGIFPTLCVFLLLGVFGVGSDEVSVSVMEGDSVSLYTGVEMNPKDRIKWYFNDIRIAQINRDQSKICTDVQCNNGTERFRDRLKLDHQTGSLTITNINTTDSGKYKLQIISGNSDRIESFSVSVIDAAAEMKELKAMSVKEGESVTLDPGVVKPPNDSMTWYFNDILIAEITGDQSQICTDDQCKERFRDRLKLDHVTGSLTITNTTNTDSGEYKLQINSGSSFSIRRIKSVCVSVSGSGLSSVVIAGISVVGVLLFVALAAGVIHYCKKVIRDMSYSSVNQNGTQSMPAANGMSHTETEAEAAIDTPT